MKKKNVKQKHWTKLVWGEKVTLGKGNGRLGFVGEGEGQKKTEKRKVKRMERNLKGQVRVQQNVRRG